MSLLNQLSSTIDSLKAAKPSRCFCNIAADSSQSNTRLGRRSEDEVVELASQGSPEVEALRVKLVSTERELQAKKAEVEAKEAELKNRNEAYHKLSIAHQTALTRFAHYKKASRLSATTFGAESRSRSLVGTPNSSGHNRLDGSKKISSSERDLALQDIPTSSRPTDLADSGTDSSDTIQFVSERRVRHGKRSSAKTTNDDGMPPERRVKEEIPQPALPSLSSAITTHTQGLDLDTADRVTATPRKLREYPAPFVRDHEPLSRPSSAPHEEQSTSFTKETRDEGSRSFGAIEFGARQRHLIDPDEQPQLSVTTKAASGGVSTSRRAVESPSNVRTKPAQFQRAFGTDRSHGQPLSERDPNIGLKVDTMINSAKASGKRKRYDHGASKVGDLTEDGVMDSSNASRPAKGRRLQDLLEGGSVGSSRSPSPQQVTLGSARSSSKPRSERQPKLRQTAVKDLQLSDFVPRPDAAQMNSSNTGSRRRKDGARHCPEGCARTECCGSAMPRFLRAAGVPKIDDHNKPMPADDSAAVRRERRTEGQFMTDKEEKLRLFMNQFDRHRENPERPASPPGYWAADMPSTQELEAIRSKTLEIEREEINKRHREATSGTGDWMFVDE